MTSASHPSRPPSSVTPTIPQTHTYTWRGYSCAYDVWAAEEGAIAPPLLLIHPIGVGLSRHFWHPFCQDWVEAGRAYPLYNPDLLGCGDSAMPHKAYTPDDWADQLLTFITEVIRRPVVVVVQGALLPVALRLIERVSIECVSIDSQQPQSSGVLGLVMAGPPGWPLISRPGKPLRQKLLWNVLFDTPLGAAFFRYARRPGFLESFSRRQLFASDQEIGNDWLTMLQTGASDPASRHAVFSFLAGFWREDYTSLIESVQQPALVVFGTEASGIDRLSQGDSAHTRLNDYLEHLPQGEGDIIDGRNVLPYESTVAFGRVVNGWLCRRWPHQNPL